MLNYLFDLIFDVLCNYIFAVQGAELCTNRAYSTYLMLMSLTNNNSIIASPGTVMSVFHTLQETTVMLHILGWN